jgi:hypothetical protein
MLRKTETKQVSFRLPMNEYEVLENSAKREHKNLSEYARNMISSSNRAISIQDQLNQLEIRLTRKLFFIQCAIAGLDKDDIREVKTQYKKLMSEKG